MKSDNNGCGKREGINSLRGGMDRRGVRRRGEGEEGRRGKEGRVSRRGEGGEEVEERNGVQKRAVRREGVGGVKCGTCQLGK